jgi:hypothetical protein
MTHDSHESSPEYIRDLYATRERATKAMLERVVLHAGVSDSKRHDDDRLEETIRQALGHTEEEIARLDPTGEYKPDRPLSLLETMANSPLEQLATPGRPLTIDRLQHIDPDLAEIAEDMSQTDISWPDDESVFHDVLPEDFDDKAFGSHLVRDHAHYNNFPAILAAEPSRPEEGEDMITYMFRTRLFMYATKPYVARAHALQPEFMGAFRRMMAEKSSMKEWSNSIYMATTEAYPDPEDQILLRASRLAYQLMINLMRKDDLQIQANILTTSLHNEITDPVVELRT